MTSTLGKRAGLVQDGAATMTRATLPHAPRVAFVCRSLDGGGAEGVMVALANAFVRAGIDVVLVLLCSGGVRVPWPDADVRVVEIKARNVALAAVPFARWLRGERVDAMLATLVGPNLLAVSAARLLPPSRRPRVVVREANTLSAALRFRSRAFRVATRLAVRLSYPRADGIVAVSSRASDDLVAVLGIARERVVSIPNPAVMPESAHLAQAPTPHRWLATDREAPVVIAAGRLVKKKGFDVLLDAFARVRTDRAARLVILGEGPERRALESRIGALGVGRDVALVGFVENPHAWFARADLFVLSSLAEGMPNALLQAMAAGCPVVATDCPSGPSEILEDGRFGALVAPGDAMALADAILVALERPGARGAVKRRALEFGIDEIAARYASVLGVAAALRETG